MALSIETWWDVRTAGAVGNGGGFATNAANFLTNLAATSATGSSPVITSASYNFVAGDVGAYVFIKSGTNWVPGWYKIVSVASNAATVDAGIGSVLLYATGRLNTSAGCASTASPSSGTGGIDYSQQTSPQFALTSIATAGTGTSFLYAGAAVNMVGNYVKVVSGTNFTVGWYQIISVSAGVSVTVDRNICSGVGASGVLNIGGAVSKHSDVSAITDNGHSIWIKNDGTYTLTASAAVFLQSSALRGIFVIGYTTTRGDNGKAIITTATNSVNLFQSADTTTWGYTFKNLDLRNTATTRGIGISLSNFGSFGGVLIANCILDGFSTGVSVSRGNPAFLMIQCEVKNCVNDGVLLGATNNNSGHATLENCWFHNNGRDGFRNASDGMTVAISCVFSANTGDGIHISSATSNASGSASTCFNCAFVSNGGHGFAWNDNSSLSVQPALCFSNCVFYGNTGKGINSTIAQTYLMQFTSHSCAFGGNSGGDRNNFPVDPSDITLTGNPFTSTTDFRLNSTAGAGLACVAAGYPTAVGS